MPYRIKSCGSCGRVETCGIDDGSSYTQGLVPRIKLLGHSCSNGTNTYIRTAVDQYAVSYGDKGCHYRNLQMMFSSLLQHTGYKELLYRTSSSQTDCSSSSENLTKSCISSISKIQKMIKGAWAQGFDIIQGAEQLGGKLVNTRKWIGATEVATLLSSLRFKCQLMDFLRSIKEDSKPPFYLQHEGHSGTVVEIEQLRNGMIFAPVIMLMSLIQVIIVNL
ncbi:hypothetical protein TKK_0006588 [Trichogramma kaykai]